MEVRKQETELLLSRKLSEWRKIIISIMLTFVFFESIFAAYAYNNFNFASALFLTLQSVIIYFFAIAVGIVSGFTCKMPTLLFSTLFSAVSIGTPALMIHLNPLRMKEYCHIGSVMCLISGIGLIFSIIYTWKTRDLIDG